MRTRIALVAIIPIAFITVSLLTLAATALPARASIRPPHAPSTHRSDQLTAIRDTGLRRPPPRCRTST